MIKIDGDDGGAAAPPAPPQRQRPPAPEEEERGGDDEWYPQHRESEWSDWGGGGGPGGERWDERDGWNGWDYGGGWGPPPPGKGKGGGWSGWDWDDHPPPGKGRKGGKGGKGDGWGSPPPPAGGLPPPLPRDVEAAIHHLRLNSTATLQLRTFAETHPDDAAVALCPDGMASLECAGDPSSVLLTLMRILPHRARGPAHDHAITSFATRWGLPRRAVWGLHTLDEQGIKRCLRLDWDEYASRNHDRPDAVTAFVMTIIGKETQRLKSHHRHPPLSSLPRRPPPPHRATAPPPPPPRRAEPAPGRASTAQRGSDFLTAQPADASDSRAGRWT